MIGFCGALDFERGAVSFSMLKKMCGLHGAGCAFVGREYGILCDGERNFSGDVMPFTARYNKSLYTAAIIADAHGRGKTGLSQSLVEGYLEEGEEYIHRLEFSYALALYDGRCGELLLAKGHRGDKPLFYTVWDKTVYFASAIRPLMRLWGGCVRVSKKVLIAHIDGDCGSLPDGLFCDIKPVRAGHSIICSRFGQSDVATLPGVYTHDVMMSQAGEIPSANCKKDIRRALTDALFAFDYPQFDCYMPSFMAHLENAKARRLRSVCLQDATLGLDEEYAAERAERLGKAAEISVSPVATGSDPLSTRVLKAMDKELDRILSEYRSDPTSILNDLFGQEYFDELNEQKGLRSRIRKKGMLCQTAMWFDSFNIVLV
ncbi:MAG: hypothetical protein IJY08_04615 [Clostridia bacterium]|nr:hypothetical protein [Clostridia bacterium]